MAQFGGRNEGEAPTEQARDTIALTVWALTITESIGPESDELVGQLFDKANNLQPVIGTADEVRDLVSRLKAAGLVRKLREYRLMTVDGHQVTCQTEVQLPSVVAMTVADRSRANNIQYRQIGTIIDATPRIDASAGIEVKFSYSASHAEPSKVSILETGGDEPLLADQLMSQQIQTVVRLKSGTAVLVRSDSSQDIGEESTDAQTQLIILGASVVPVLEELERTTAR